VGLLGATCLSVACYAQDAGQLVLSSEFSSFPARRPKVIQPVKALKPPDLDGVLDDACWGPCIPQELGSEMGGPVTRSTLVRACYDEVALYFAFECQEPAIADLPPLPPPPKPNTPPVVLPHDEWSADNVQARLTFPDDPDEMYLFAVGITGIRFESSLLKGKAWSPDWEARAGRTPTGWTVEMAIPLSAFGNRRIVDKGAWQANFARDVSLSGERCTWEATSGNPVNPALWGTMFFGDSQAFARMETPTRISLFPVRWTLTPDDRTLRMVVRVDPGNQPLSKCRLRLAVTPEKGTAGVPRQALIPLKGERANLILDAALLPIGSFVLEAELMDAAGGGHGLTKVTLRREDGAAAALRPGQFELIIPDYGVKTRTAESWPMSVGVALPKGAVRDPANVRLLDHDGAEIPSRATVRGRWPGDGTIRWVALDFRANLSRGAQTLTVQYGPQVTAKRVLGFTRNLQVRYEKAENIYVTEKGNAWWVNTGELLFKVNQTKFSGVEQTWVDVDKNGQYDFNEQILNGEASDSGPFVVDGGGHIYRISGDPNFRMQLEEMNELRVVLRGEGRLLPVDASGGPDVGRCVFRLTAYAGQPFLNAQYSFFFNDRAVHNPLSDIGISEKMDYDFRRRLNGPDVLFGAPEGFQQSLKQAGTMFMIALGGNEFTVQNLKDPLTVNVSGTGAQEWSCIAASDRGMALCLRDMTRLHPKEFEVNADGRVLVHFWPPHGDDRVRSSREEINRNTVGRLDFAHYGRWLDLTVPPSYSAGLKDQNDLPEFDAVRDMGLADPTGVAVTYDVLYFFYRGAAAPGDISAICKLFAQRPHAVQSPESLAAANVLPDMLPPARAARAAGLLDRLLALDAARGPDDGDFNYQDVRRTWLPREQRWSLKDYWLGTTGDRLTALWMVYLQTGRPDALLAAQRMVRHLIDVDMCHEAPAAMGVQADPRRRKVAGGFGDHHTPVHWQSTWHLSDRVPRLRGLLLSYYATGDLLARDMALKWAEAVKEHGTPFPGEDGMVYLDNLSDLLMVDYDAALQERLGDCADYFFRMPPALDNVDVWIPGLRNYLRQSADPRAAAYLRRVAAAMPHDDLRLLGLLRDVQQAAPANELNGQMETIVQAYEQQADKIMAAPLSKNEPLTWEAFCSYVFGATVPSSTLIPPAPAEPPAAPAAPAATPPAQNK